MITFNYSPHSSSLFPLLPHSFRYYLSPLLTSLTHSSSSFLHMSSTNVFIAFLSESDLMLAIGTGSYL